MEDDLGQPQDIDELEQLKLRVQQLEQASQPLGAETHTQQLQTPVIQQWNLPSKQRSPNYLMIGAICITIILILTASVTFLVIYSVDSKNTGVSEGQLVPDIVSKGHAADGTWDDFRLYDYINHSWDEGEPGEYIFLQFMDSDCGHCWNDAQVMSDNHAAYGASGAVVFITVSVGMLASDHSRAEIVAFQEKGDFVGCYESVAPNCNDRPGEPHDWIYVDDLNQDAFQDYNLRGVPFHLLMSPDGIVVWNSGAHDQDDPLHEASAAIQEYVVGGA
jgi:hypothetical protein